VGHTRSFAFLNSTHWLPASTHTFTLAFKAGLAIRAQRLYPPSPLLGQQIQPQANKEVENAEYVFISRLWWRPH
jgi:hypothetical protein